MVTVSNKSWLSTFIAIQSKSMYTLRTALLTIVNKEIPLIIVVSLCLDLRVIEVKVASTNCCDCMH